MNKWKMKVWLAYRACDTRLSWLLASHGQLSGAPAMSRKIMYLSTRLGSCKESLAAYTFLLVYIYLHFDHLRLQGDTKGEHSKVPSSPSNSFASANLHINGKATAWAWSSHHQNLLPTPRSCADINLHSPVTKLDPVIELPAGSRGWSCRFFVYWGFRTPAAKGHRRAD